jgi:hypothetical protein
MPCPIPDCLPVLLVDSDVADVAMRLRPSEGGVQELRMAALALRVSRAIANIG